MKISVIIPCFNAENHIQECLESILTQSHQDLEIICVNDGSSDQTQEIIEGFQASSSIEIKLINQENHGAQFARNIGAQNASGKYFQFLDADDLLLVDKLAVQVALAESNDYPAIIAGSYIRQDNFGKELGRKILHSKKEFNVWDSLMKTELGITSANLFFAEPFKNGVEWDVKFKHSQEYQLMFQILQRKESVAFDSQPLTIRRAGNSKTSSQHKEKDKWADYVQLRVDIISYLKGHRLEVLQDDHFQHLFDAIRMYYPHNPAKAVETFNKSIPANYKPSVSMATGSGYLQLYAIFGFEWTEKIRAVISRLKA